MRSARIASSCSAWMVATMSRIRPVRSWSSAANSAPFAHHREPGLGGGLGVEHLVVDAEESPTLGLEVPTAGDAHGLDCGGAVEGLGDRGPPVDDQWRQVVVGDRDPADVVRGRLAALPRPEVEPPEAQRRLADVEAGQPAAGVRLGGLALEPGLVRAAAGDVGVSLRDLLGGPTHHLEAGVRRIQVALLRHQFRIQLGVGRGRRRARRRVGQETNLRRLGTDEFTPSAAKPVAKGSVSGSMPSTPLVAVPPSGHGSASSQICCGRVTWSGSSRTTRSPRTMRAPS